jgi:DNA-binding MarR family transcriptional regulator
MKDRLSFISSFSNSKVSSMSTFRMEPLAHIGRTSKQWADTNAVLNVVSDTAHPSLRGSEADAQISSGSTLAALLCIAKSTRAIYGLKLATMGLHNGQDELLIAIGSEGTTVSVLADRLMVRPSTVSKMMDRLIEKDLVDRFGDHRDARRTLIRITQAGSAMRERLIEMRSEVDAELAKAMNAGSPSSAEGGACTPAHLAACAAALVKHLRRLR